MKVQPGARPNVAQLQEKSQTKSTDATRDSAQTQGERVNVSSTSKLLAEARASSSNEVDGARVERLRNSIQAGAFKVDHEKVGVAAATESQRVRHEPCREHSETVAQGSGGNQ